ncbi:arginine decarboxylase [Roseiflexus sp. RS-1]|uniref:arginine decarboxylase n=1 Tax=Roseiflexus sp. (strain RS-1) TaxID=357808 RepID=UPI0000D810D5|nr:arginine decarboxylase [Roseiflexus sp. RS-1]ABQ91208.1 Orn/DAP/Arg decarboxylase 2 [Roseiflexus sp. RS-1]
MNGQPYVTAFTDRYGVGPEGQINDFISRRGDRLLLADQIDLNAMVARYGAPLEVAYCPQITLQIERMLAWADDARMRSGYVGGFIYAYATKANFAEEVVRTAIGAGAHYETSAAADVTIAHRLWQQGVLPSDRYIFCNGSKDDAYLAAISALRRAGFARVVPVIDDLDELETLLAMCREPLLLGVRERHAPADVDADHPGGERFGLTPDEIEQVVERLRHTPHRLVMYHAMVGSQIEDADRWNMRLARSAEAYARLRQQAPSLMLFNFGGGMPTSAYSLDFRFDYVGFLERLMRTLASTCAAHNVPQPTLVGEFGRYTVASHNVFIMEVGRVKRGQGDAPDWVLINGSLMVSLPDSLIVPGQEFIILPLDGWDRPVRPVRLAGRLTCDSDDFFPRPGAPPLLLPDPYPGQKIAFFGVGAYQQMIAGRGGAHHCLTPEMRRIIIERDEDALVVREVAPQNLGQIMALLGYACETLELPVHQPVRAPVERRVVREPLRLLRSARRRNMPRGAPPPRYGSAARHM